MVQEPDDDEGPRRLERGDAQVGERRRAPLFSGDDWPPVVPGRPNPQAGDFINAMSRDAVTADSDFVDGLESHLKTRRQG